MEISTSDLLAGITLIATAFYARRQTQQQSAANTTSYRNSLAEHLRPYSDLLNQSIHRQQERQRELSSLAGNATNSVQHLLDDYDLCRDSSRPLRHLVGEAAEMVQLAFTGQLGWQSAENIEMRIRAFNHIEDRLDPRIDLYSSDFRREFRQRYATDPNRWEDHCLPTDRNFCALVKALQERLEGKRRGELLSAIMKEVQGFAVCHDKLRPAMIEDAERLERALIENEIDEFDLRESPALFKRLEFEMCRLKTLATIRLVRIETQDAHRYLNHTSLCIQICALLFIIQAADQWGWGGF